MLCYGTISVENVTRLSHLPTPRRDATAVQEHDLLGGEALTVAVPLATWGLRVAVVGQLHRRRPQGRAHPAAAQPVPALDTRYIIQHPNVDTPFTRVFVDPNGERSRVAYWYDQTPKDELLPSMMARARLLSVDAYGKDERDRAAQVARSLGRPVISADAIWPQHPLASLSSVIVISSAFLQSSFTGVYEYDHALELQAQGAGVVIVTDGPKAVLVVRADGSPFGVEPYEVAPGDRHERRGGPVQGRPDLRLAARELAAGAEGEVRLRRRWAQLSSATGQKIRRRRWPRSTR